MRHERLYDSAKLAIATLTAPAFLTTIGMLDRSAPGFLPNLVLQLYIFNINDLPSHGAFGPDAYLSNRRS